MVVPTVPVSIKINTEMRARIKRIAESRKRSTHWLLREAIHQFVEREETRDAFLRRGEEAWRHFRETGLHITGQEVEDWLSTWGEADEAESPACHS